MEANVFYSHCMNSLERVFRPMVPYTPEDTVINGKLRRASTGNMRFNATKILKIAPNTVQIKVDSAIAPYVVYTNEPWRAEKWRGAQNPNEGWFEKATKEFARNLAISLQGTLKKG